jgi:hypothetical protein
LNARFGKVKLIASVTRESLGSPRSALQERGLPCSKCNSDERLYKDAQRRATEAGFSSVDEYVADDLVERSPDQTPNLDHLFTPERLGLIDAAAAEIKDGNSFTAEQVREHFKKKRAAWT